MTVRASWWNAPPLQIALFTDAFADRSLADTVAWCAGHGVEGIELGVGGYSAAPHAPLDALLREARERRRLQDAAASGGLTVVALNASGNPLHPDAAVANAHDAQLRAAIELAQLLGVGRVVAMSGCPGGPGGGLWPVFAGGAWLPDMEGLWDWQWRERIEPYWRELSRWAAAIGPDVAVCLELHPGTSIYNPESFATLREAVGDNVRVNLDPSHFWWQGMEPLLALELLDDAVAFAHGKDLLLQRELVAQHGTLDFRWPGRPETSPWHFAAVGTAHGIDEWAQLLGELDRRGVDVISIEHEDPRTDAEQGVLTSIAALAEARARL